MWLCGRAMQREIAFLYKKEAKCIAQKNIENPFNPL
jgi:hypothetical protein